MNRSPGRQPRSGFTVLELIVVLVVLVALAGIVIPLLPNMLGRSHHSTSATNLGQINNFVQSYEQTNLALPNDLDNLVSGSGIIDYLPGGTAGHISAYSLPALQKDALLNAGISRVATLYPTETALTAAGGSPTFNPYSSTTTTVIATDMSVARLSEGAVEGTLAADIPGILSDDPARTGDVYVVFGFGRKCSMVGRSVTSPPTHFGEGSGTNASAVYARFGLVFRVARGNGTATPTPLTRAVFVGSVEFHTDRITGRDAHLEEYHNITKNQ